MNDTEREREESGKKRCCLRMTTPRECGDEDE
jgi:hypothetical protein